MTFRTVLGISKKPLFCLVCWPEEDNQLSVVSTKKIVSPHLEELVPEAFCKVKKFEKCLCRIVAVGTEGEMNKKMEMKEELERQQEEDTQPPPKKKSRQMQEEGDSQEAQPPPKKRTRKVQRPVKDKENKTPRRSAKKTPSTILVVGSKMSSEPLKELQPSVTIPEVVKEVTFVSHSTSTTSTYRLATRTLIFFSLVLSSRT